MSVSEWPRQSALGRVVSHLYDPYWKHSHWPSNACVKEALRLAAGYSITHVPCRGTVEAMSEVVAGRIDMFPAPALNAINLSNEGSKLACGQFAEAFRPDV